MTPLRILGTHLQTLLLERDGDLPEETARFARLWLDLESALTAQRQIMTIGQNLFGQQPALYPRSVAKADRLRDVGRPPGSRNGSRRPSRIDGSRYVA